MRTGDPTGVESPGSSTTLSTVQGRWNTHCGGGRLTGGSAPVLESRPIGPNWFRSEPRERFRWAGSALALPERQLADRSKSADHSRRAGTQPAADGTGGASRPAAERAESSPNRRATSGHAGSSSRAAWYRWACTPGARVAVRLDSRSLSTNLERTCDTGPRNDGSADGPAGSSRSAAGHADGIGCYRHCLDTTRQAGSR